MKSVIQAHGTRSRPLTMNSPVQKHQTMTQLRCKPGDLAIVIKATIPENLGLIVKVICRDPGKDIIRFHERENAWFVESQLPMTWLVNQKKYQRLSGPVPDAVLQPIKGDSPKGDMKELEEIQHDNALDLQTC